MDSSNKTVALVDVMNHDANTKMRIAVGLVYVGSALKKHGYKVKIFQPTKEKEIQQQVEQEIIKDNPLFVGFSAFIGSNLAMSLDMSERLKEALDVTIVWGGKFPSSIPDLVLKEDCIDVVCLGEGEETIVELAKTFESGGSLDKIKGICYKADGRIVHNEEREPIHDLDSLEYDINLIQDWSKYVSILNGRIRIFDPFESQRGCPFSCNFCHQSMKMWSKNGKKIIRAHSVDWILKRAKQLKELTGVEYISFCDDEFWIKKSRAFELLEGLYSIGIKVNNLRMRFSSLQNEEMIERLIKYGILNMGFGLESGSDRILGLMNKKQTTKQVEEKLRLVDKYPQMVCGGAIILGSPGETKKDMIESVRFVLNMCQKYPRFRSEFYFYQPLPGTVFGNMAVDLGFDPPQSIREWAKVDGYSAHKIAKGWLPWFNRREEINFERARRYISLARFDQTREDSQSSEKMGLIYRLKRRILRVFEILAAMRLYHWFFYFPIEFYILGAYRHLTEWTIEE